MNLSDFKAVDAFSPVFCGELSHAYIICCPSRPCADALADTLAAAMLCESARQKPCGTCVHCRKSARGVHPDVTIVERAPDKQEIQVEQIRVIRSDTVILPNEAPKKVYVIRGADTMNTAAQNAMLKSLEEPPAHAAFILTAENPSLLLPTVRSRCAEISLCSEEEPVSDDAAELALRFFQALSDGALALTRFTFELEKLNRVRFSEFLRAASEAAVTRLRASMSAGAGSGQAIHLARITDVLEKASESADANVGVGHICGMLCAALTEKTCPPVNKPAAAEMRNHLD